MCGRSLKEDYPLLDSGGAFVVRRVYGGPGKVAQKGLKDRSAQVHKRDWVRKIQRTTRGLAARLGIFSNFETENQRLQRALEEALRLFGLTIHIDRYHLEVLLRELFS